MTLVGMMTQLGPLQDGNLTTANELLARPVTGHDVMDYAARVGALEWALAEMISLVEQLAGNA